MSVWKICGKQIFFVAIGILLSAMIAGLLFRSSFSRWNIETRMKYSKVEQVKLSEVEDDQAAAGVRKEYCFPVPDQVPEGSCLAFYTVHQYVRVYLEEKEVYHLLPAGENVPVKTVGSNWNIIPLSPKDQGKEVRVEITPVYQSFRNRPVIFLTGSLPDIFMDRFYQDLPQLALGIMTLLTGIVTMCIAGYSQIIKKQGKEIIFLGLFSVMLGIWKLTDTRFTPFLFPDHPVQVSMVTLLMLLFGPIPILQWIRVCTAKEKRRHVDLLCMLDLGLISVQLILQFLGIRDLRQILPFSHGVLLGSLLFAAWQMLKEWKKGDTDENSSLKQGGGTLRFCWLQVYYWICCFSIRREIPPVYCLRCWHICFM